MLLEHAHVVIQTSLASWLVVVFIPTNVLKQVVVARYYAIIQLLSGISDRSFRD
jgi:hypothetical protein